MLPAEAVPQHSRCVRHHFPNPLGYEFLIYLIPILQSSETAPGSRMALQPHPRSPVQQSRARGSPLTLAGHANLWVQMTIPLQTREEGRLTRLQRAETGATPPGQTTLITSTPRWSIPSPRTTPMRWTSHRRLAPPRTGLRQLECLLPGCRRALLRRKPYWTRKGLT